MKPTVLDALASGSPRSAGLILVVEGLEAIGCKVEAMVCGGDLGLLENRRNGFSSIAVW